MEYQSFLSSIDWALKARIFAEVGPILGLTDVDMDAVIYPRDIALRKISEKRGRDVVEFFNIWRTSSPRDMLRQRTPVARRGITTRSASPELEISTDVIKAMPMNLNYDIWFWTQSLDKKNQIEEWFAWWIHTDPNLDMFYNDIYPLEFDLLFGTTADEGTVSEEYSKGVYHVLRVSLELQGWVFKAFEQKIIRQIMLAIYDENVQSHHLAYREYNAKDEKLPDEQDSYNWFLSQAGAFATIVDDEGSRYDEKKVLQIDAPIFGAHELTYKNNEGLIPEEAESFGKACQNFWGYEIRLRLKVISSGSDFCQFVKIEDREFQYIVRWSNNKIIFSQGTSFGIADIEYAIDLTDKYHVIGISMVNTYLEITVDGEEVIRVTLASPTTEEVPNVTWGDSTDGSAPLSGGICRYDYVKYLCKTGMLHYKEIGESL
jgi:hypothetical protein